MAYSPYVKDSGKLHMAEYNLPASQLCVYVAIRSHPQSATAGRRSRMLFLGVFSAPYLRTSASRYVSGCGNDTPQQAPEGRYVARNGNPCHSEPRRGGM